MDTTFGPKHRLHDNRDYSRVFHRQQKAAGRHIVVLLRPRDRRETPLARLGVMISSKTAPLSVRRHQLKRWVRESFRLSFKEILAGHDVVVLFRNDPPENAHALIEQELRLLIPKALTAAAQPGSRNRSGQTPRPAQKHSATTREKN